VNFLEELELLELSEALVAENVDKEIYAPGEAVKVRIGPVR
jgi:hypothetical protein